MKVVLLAGGFGTRLAEYTDLIPKPMVTIGDKPILWHIMNLYSKFGHKDFFIALGYKSEVIKDFFLNYKVLNSDFEIDLKSGVLNIFSTDTIDWKVNLVSTGEYTMTGGRLKRMKNYIGNESFLLTYGDGLSNVNINDLIKFHKSHGKLVTITAVRPAARFGELEIINNNVKNFKEKPQLHQGWINGGFFVIEPEFFNYLDDDSTVLEQSPLEKLAADGQLMAYLHDGFWQCMDTKRDRDMLQELLISGNAPWL